jgi:hypothetical protein
LTVVLIVVELARIGSSVLDVEQAATWTLASTMALLWAIVVAFGHPRYSLVLRITGGPEGSR